MAKETQKWRKEEGGREGEREERERERDEERVESTFSRLLAESIPCEPSGEGKYNGDLQDVKGLPHTILTTSPNCSSSSFCYKARGIATRSKDATRGLLAFLLGARTLLGASRMVNDGFQTFRYWSRKW